MVVDDPDLVGVPSAPAENDAPLFVDADGMETRAASLQCFQSIARWNAQVAELRRVVQIQELPACDAAQCSGKASDFPGLAVVEQVLGESIREAPDHCIGVS